MAGYEHNAGNTVEPITLRPVTLAGEWNGSQYMPVTTMGETSRDASGRLKVSQPATLFDSKQILDNGPLLWDESVVTGAGTFTHSINKASTI